jgi:hypothetical protein
MGQRWGKQIAVAMTERDEKKFLTFLRSTADIQILVSPARMKEDLCLPAFPRRGARQMQLFLWNRKFAWDPDCGPNTAGTFYIRNIARAPVVEYLRDPLSWAKQDRGRLYWSKGITPGGSYDFEQYPYAYDAQEFDKWHSLIVPWVKKNSRSKRTSDLPIYYLSGAWRWHPWHTL